MMNKRLIVIMLTASSIALTACDRTTADPSDRTPPLVELAVSSRGERVVLRPDSSDVTWLVTPGQNIMFVATAIDEDGGVQRVSISRTASHTCAEGDVAGRGLSEFFPEEYLNEASPGEETATWGSVASNVEIPTGDPCRGGYHLAYRGGSVTATATNYAGMEVSTAVFIYEQVIPFPVIHVPCGDGICNADYEDNISCPEDCGEPEEVLEIDPESITPVPTDTPTPVPPLSINFNADNYAIKAGECTTIRWQVENANEVSLEGQQVKSLDARQVCPQKTTSYKLLATSPGGEQEARVTIEVERLQPPAAPTKLAITGRVCTDTAYSVTLGWKDNAGNEDGYRVYREAQLIATLGKNATKYTDNPPGSGPYTYSVEAFNSAGASGHPSVQEVGCLY